MNTVHATRNNDEARLDVWRAAWPLALAAWSRYTRLTEPRLCLSHVEAAREGLGGSFAMIRLLDQSVVIDLESTAHYALDGHAVEILAHEIGHHILAPATAADQMRLLARIRRALPTLERHAPLVANLYTDLLINDRLQRQAGLRMADIYVRLRQALEPDASNGGSAVWQLTMGIYERLWQLAAGSLGGPTDGVGATTHTTTHTTAHTTLNLTTDAWLGARLIRVYAGDWMDAAGRFASLLLPYLVEDKDQNDHALAALQDTRDAARGCEVAGVQDVEPDEIDGNVHPSQDARVTGVDNADITPTAVADARGVRDVRNVADAGAHSQSRGQAREPFEYGELLRAAGVELSDHEIAVRYYRERALPHLVRFPTHRSQHAPEPQMEGLEPWALGDALDDLDVMQSILQSPHVIPGYSTVRRVYGTAPAQEAQRVPVDLDLYVDSSGSMPNPQQQTSVLALAGAAIALSALRVGSAVQVTLWSGKSQVMHTPGFVRNEEQILRVLTGFYGGGTTFPIHRLRDTYSQRPSTARPVHILHVSDDGITTMFDTDERGNSGWQVAAQALAAARGGGTMALNIVANWHEQTQGGDDRSGGEHPYSRLRRAHLEQGWSIHAITQMQDQLAFARAFSHRHYSADEAPA